MRKIRHHSSGPARVTLGGVVHDRGRYGSIEAQRRHLELIEQGLRNICPPPRALPAERSANRALCPDLLPRYAPRPHHKIQHAA